VRVGRRLRRGPGMGSTGPARPRHVCGRGRRTRGSPDVRGRFERHARTVPPVLVAVFRAVFTAATRRGRFPRPPGGSEKASRCVCVARAASGGPEPPPKEARPQCDTCARGLQASHTVSRAKLGNLGAWGGLPMSGLIRRAAWSRLSRGVAMFARSSPAGSGCPRGRPWTWLGASPSTGFGISDGAPTPSFSGECRGSSWRRSAERVGRRICCALGRRNKNGSNTLLAELLPSAGLLAAMPGAFDVRAV